MKLYNGKVDVQFSEAAHRYKVDGKYKEGVTSIIKILSKDGLIQWAANMVCEYIRANCQPLSASSKSIWQVSELDLKKAKYAHASFRDDSADIGKQVHKWIENHINGNDTEVSVQMRPSIDAFLRWEARAKPTYIASERVVYSKEHDYCGTTDVLAQINGERTVIDFKTGKPDEEWNARQKRYTGKKRARTTHFLQDAFYDIAMGEEDGILATRYAVLYLPLNGKVHFYDTAEVELYRQLAIDLLHAHRSLKEANFKNQFRED